MALPAYDKSKRRKSYEILPKGAYVVKIIGAREDKNSSGVGSHLAIAFDIAEGEYKGLYGEIYAGNNNEDKKWPVDAMFYLGIPDDSSKQYIWDNWNTFFADLEDSNDKFVFGGNVNTLKGKLIGGKFAIEQTEYNGNIYDHTRLRWTCVAQDVRDGKAGKMPNDRLINRAPAQTAPRVDTDGFMSIPDGVKDDELPF